MKQALLLLLAVSVEGIASGVGASNPQVVNTAPTKLAAAIVDTGASNRWSAQPTAHKASKREIKKFEIRVEGFDAKVNQELNTLISRKIETLLAEDK